MSAPTNNQEPLVLKSFRGGISPDGYKGARGSFGYGYGLDIHGGRDSLKSNQKLKKDSGSVITEQINVMLPASDGNVYAFGQSGGVYRKKSGAWTKVLTLSAVRGPITGAIEYVTDRGPYILYASEMYVHRISLENAGRDNWSTDSDLLISGEAGLFAAETFDVTYDAAHFGAYINGRITPAGSATPELTVAGRAEAAAGASTTLTVNLTVPADSNRMMVIQVCEYDTTGTLSSITVNGSATGIVSELNTSGGGSFASRLTLRRLPAPPSGSVSIVATFSANTHRKFMRVLVFKDATDAAVLLAGGGTGEVNGYQETIVPSSRFENRFLFIMSEAGEHYGAGQLSGGSATIESLRTDSAYVRDRSSERVPHFMSYGAGNVVIGNGDRLALVDFDRNFTKNALALPPGLVAQGIKEQSTETYNRIIIGCNEPGMDRAWLVTWDGTSDTWQSKKRAKTSTIGAFDFLEGGIVLQGEGQFRYWDFIESHPLRVVPGTESSAIAGVAEYRTLPHFGLNGGSKCGVYSIGRVDKNDPIAVNLEYVPSHGQFENVTIDAIAATETELYVAWTATINAVVTYGIDVIDQENKAVSVYESLLLDMGRPEVEKLVTTIKVVLAAALPASATVGVQYRATRTPNGEWVTAQMAGAATIATTGARKGIFRAEANGEDYEVRVTITPAGNNSPEISSITNMFRYTDKY